MCVSVKPYSLTLYVFWNRQHSSVIETERNAFFYSKHTPSSQFQRFSVWSRYFCKTLQLSHKRHKKLLAIVSTFASRELVLVELVSPMPTLILLLIWPLKLLIIKIPFPYSAETLRIMETRQKWYKMVLLRCKMVLKRHLFYPLFSTFEYTIFSIRFVKDACT